MEVNEGEKGDGKGGGDGKRVGSCWLVRFGPRMLTLGLRLRHLFSLLCHQQQLLHGRIIARMKQL